MNKLLREPKSKIRRPPDPAKPKILFVCWGNVCRSPAAKSIFEKYCRRQHLPPMIVESAGVCVDEFPPPPSLSMRWAALIRGYSLSSQHRSVYRNDLDEYDLVVSMDQRVFQALETVHRHPSSQMALLSDFLPRGGPLDVPDPMNRSRRTCHYVLDLIETACPAIAEAILGCEREEGSTQVGKNPRQYRLDLKSSGFIAGISSSAIQ